MKNSLGIFTIRFLMSVLMLVNLAVMIAHAQQPALLKTQLDVLTQGSPGKEFEEWGKVLMVNQGRRLTFRWATKEPGAVGADWEVTTQNASNQYVVVAKGVLNKAPAPPAMDIFYIEDGTFLAKNYPPSAKKFYVRVTAFDTQKNQLGLAAVVSVTQGPPGPATVSFDDLDWKPPPAAPEPGHPSVRLIKFNPLNETQDGSLLIQLFNPTKKDTDTVDMRITDTNLVARGKEGSIRIKPLKPGERRLITFTLIPQLTAGSPTVEQERAKWWLERYPKGVAIFVLTSKVPTPYLLHYHLPAIYTARADVSSCANGIKDGTEDQTDCNGICPNVCEDCFADAWPGQGDAAEYFSLNSQAVKDASQEALDNYRIHLKWKTGNWPSEDYFDPAVVGNNLAAERIISAVARYVDTNMTYFIDSYDGWGEASAERTILKSGNRLGKTKDDAETAEFCTNMYCGDCEDFAFLRFALIRALGVGRRCVWVADHHESHDQGQGNCPKSKDGGHTYNIVYWHGKYRILDYTSKVRPVTSNKCWSAHATDAIYNDVYGDYWASPETQLSPNGKLHLNYPGSWKCGGPGWNWKTFYTDVCP